MSEFKPNMRKGKGKIIRRSAHTRKKEYPKFFIYIPTNVAQDSNFPFEVGEDVEIVIEGNELRIKKS